MLTKKKTHEKIMTKAVKSEAASQSAGHSNKLLAYGHDIFFTLLTTIICALEAAIGMGPDTIYQSSSSVYVIKHNRFRIDINNSR
jgi:hypothetical protein